MKIAIIGYGKMGKMVEQEAQNLNIPISQIIDNKNDLLASDFDDEEVAIEFTEPATCIENIGILASKGVNISCGTTGWHQDIERAKEIVLTNNIGLIYATNFAIGVNIFWKVVKEAACIVDKFDEYDVFGHEIHHNKKKDSPSGTALTTAKILVDNIKRKKHIITERVDRGMKPDELHFSSTRGGYVIGKHEVVFDSSLDSIKIAHDSKGRSTYARGAINCAKWIRDKKGFFNINDYMEELLI